GKDMIMRVMDGEEMRIEKERARVEIVPIARKTIPLLHDVAAGPTDVFGEIMDEYEIDADSPANFAIQISGDSMEPFLPDGSVQLGIMGNGLETGDIGVFMLDGGLLCKQYVKDNYGNIYLNSLNRDRSENDVAIFSSGNRRIDCVGKVLVKEKIPVQM
ncbi:MAG: S24 family peptidase, partial [Oscillospiraceae bacterium]|nr:S24 family peptidase [Oscillospiraceae bacterium]